MNMNEHTDTLNDHAADAPPVPAFVVQPKAPQIVVPPSRTPKILRVRQLFSVLPARALTDKRIKSDAHSCAGRVRCSRQAVG